MTSLELNLLNKAINKAQTEPGVAFAIFENLHERHPDDLNLLLWLFHTAPAPTDIAVKHLDKLKELDPHNPLIHQFEQKMRQQVTNSSHLSKFFPLGGLPNFLVFLIATFVLTGVAAYLITYIISYKLNTVEATATTVGYVVYAPPNKRSSGLYAPQVQFWAQDRQSYKVALPLQVPGQPQNGTTYTIFYHRNNPNRVEVNSFPDTTPLAIVVTIVALICGTATLQMLSKARKQHREYKQRFGYQAPKEPYNV